MSIVQESLVNFFKCENNFKKLNDIISNKNTQPRLLDYYITQLSKNDPQFIYISKDSYEGVIDVYTSYKLMLKSYHKKSFNLFDKAPIVTLQKNDVTITSSVSKLSVYKWLIENKISDYIEDNIDMIQASYYSFRKTTLAKNRSGIRRRGKMNTFLKNPIILKHVKKFYNDAKNV
tara:strand:- start:6613 stop:7137 length:525 start_codon:yes stop_codon:yes gene_type:complete